MRKADETISLSPCPYCSYGERHPPERCPRVKSIQYDERGRVKSVEFMRPVDYIQGPSRPKVYT